MDRRRPARNGTPPRLEPLDRRIVPSGGGSAADEALVSARGGQALGAIYQEYITYQQSGAVGSFQSPESARVAVSGTSVGVDIRFGSGDFDTLVGQLEAIGMRVTGTAPQIRIVEGFLPISALPAIAGNSHESSLGPIYRPINNNPAPVVPPSPQAALVARVGGSDLGSIYGEYASYEQSGGVGAFRPAESSRVSISGTSVGVDIRFGSGDFNALVGQLEALGMRVTAAVPLSGIVEGFLPISALPTVAGNSHLAGLVASHRPVGD